MSYIESLFFVSLAITFVLILFLIYHFKQRISSLEQKTETMFGIVNSIVKEVKYITTEVKRIQPAHNMYVPLVEPAKTVISLSSPAPLLTKHVEIEDEDEDYEEDDESEDDEEESEDDEEESEEDEEESDDEEVLEVEIIESEPEEVIEPEEVLEVEIIEPEKVIETKTNEDKLFDKVIVNQHVVYRGGKHIINEHIVYNKKVAKGDLSYLVVSYKDIDEHFVEKVVEEHFYDKVVDKSTDKLSEAIVDEAIELVVDEPMVEEELVAVEEEPIVVEQEPTQEPIVVEEEPIKTEETEETEDNESKADDFKLHLGESKKNLKKMNLTELKQLAAIKLPTQDISKLKKEDLIKLLKGLE
jgi:hypothetical protein